MTGPSAAQRDEKTSEPWTIRRVLTWTQQHFAARRIPSPRLDAELLLAHCLGKPRVALYTHYDQPLEPSELERFRGLIRRRVAGEPVAYLIGQKEFYGLPLRVSAAVLIPRPETEHLVEEALRLLAALAPPARLEAVPQSPDAPDETDSPTTTDSPGATDAAATAAGAPGLELQTQATPGLELTVHYDPPAAEAASEDTSAAAEPVAARPEPDAATTAAGGPVVVDVGTGSGAVALALKHSRRELRVLAIDRSPEALAVAADNAARLDLAVEFLEGDLLAPLPADVRPDVIVANLPYIPTAEIAGLMPEVRSEPHAALDGGPDGLELIRRLVRQAAERLQPGGALLLELGQGQAPAVEELLHAAGFVGCARHTDLAGIERVVTGRRPARRADG
ncbi:MAG: HemK/PrmC family methyltransferase [Polyangia bacterium]